VRIYLPCALLAALVVVPLTAGAGQPPAAAAGTTKAAVKAVRSLPARTSWGDPDIQAIWSNASAMPIAQPAQVVQATPNPPANTPRGTGAGPEHWYEARPIVFTGQLPIVDPPGGKVPMLTSAAKERADAVTRIRRRRVEGPEDLSPWDRCITRGIPGSMIPINYGNNYQIIQSPGYIVILYEMIHDARIITMDGRPHLSEGVRQWMGDARGRWEGTTLVVETTNFTDKTQIIYGDGFHSQRLRIIERFTVADADTLQYQFTVEDPATWTTPWTAAIPLTKDHHQHRIFEYACHEGNYAMPNSLNGARAEERAEQAAKTSNR
jgi:hypothetical protein